MLLTILARVRVFLYCLFSEVTITISYSGLRREAAIRGRLMFHGGSHSQIDGTMHAGRSEIGVRLHSEAAH